MNHDITPCMGGFCVLREKCQHHQCPNVAKDPAERLCEPGGEREMFFLPVALGSTESGVQP